MVSYREEVLSASRACMGCACGGMEMEMMRKARFWRIGERGIFSAPKETRVKKEE
jgi:hypothetical protein